MKKEKFNVGIVGATGMVGETFIKLLNEESFPIEELRLFASENSKGKEILFQNQSWPIKTLEEGCFDGLDFVFFSSGDEISKNWAPVAERAGAIAIDNSAAFRMSAEHLLLVPEVNGKLLKDKSPKIIANPNCSTIQLVVALNPLKKFGIKSVHVSTYQAVSGGGKEAQSELIDQTNSFGQRKRIEDPQVFPHQIFSNCIPEIGSFDENGFCSEERKIIHETKKILDLNDIFVSAFTVRVPVMNSHSEAVWVELDQEISKEEILMAFQEQSGLKVIDHPQNHAYPLALRATETNPVYVGRIHQDPKFPKTWIFWVVADNIRKGAALNGLQIAQMLEKF